MAAAVAVPSPPSPWVAKTMVCCAFAEVCGLAPPEELHAAAAPSRPARAAASAARRARRPGCALVGMVILEYTSQVGSAAPLRRYRQALARRGEIGFEGSSSDL